MGGSGSRFERRELDPAFSLGKDLYGRISRQLCIKSTQGLSHGLLQLGNESLRFKGLVQGLIIGDALGLKVPRQILIRIAVAVSTGYPDLLGAKLLPKRPKSADFVGNPVDLLVSIVARFDDKVLPGVGYHALDGHVRIFGVETTVTIGMLPDHLQGLDDWAVDLIVGAKFQHI